MSIKDILAKMSLQRHYIASVSLNNSDSTTFIITLSDTLWEKNNYTISYTPRNIQSRDQGQLTAFNSMSVYNLLTDCQYFHTVPSKIETEEYYRMQGTSTIYCSDQGGEKRFPVLAMGDWAEYYVNVPQSGTYLLEYRIATLADTGQIELLMSSKDTIVLTSNLPATGLWDTWQNVSAVVQLSGGPQVIRMYASLGGFRSNWIWISSATGVKDNDSRVVKEFQLLQNYPDPFNPSTVIKYQVPKTSLVTLRIFDILGREVIFLVNEEEPAGTYNIQWDEFTKSSSMYFYRLIAGSFIETKRMMLLK